MNKKTAFLLLTIFISSNYFSFAQFRYNKMASPTFYNSMNSRYTVKTANLSTGVQLEFIEQGDSTATPVILLHGYTDSWHSFETTVQFLPANLHVFAITQRGHGNSSKPDAGYHPKDFAEDIAAFVREHQLGPVFIVGHSMGGVITQQFALDYPSLTKGIILVSTDAFFKENPGMPEFYNEVLKLTDPISYQFAEAFQKETVFRPIDKNYYKLLVSESLKLPAHVWKSTMNGFLNIDYTKELSRISCPALIVWGNKDVFCSQSDQDLLLKGIRNSALLLYDGTGHALHWEEPGRFAADIVNFIHPSGATRRVSGGDCTH